MKPGNYRRVTCHGHPRADCQGHVLEHVLIAEKALGRALPDGVEVHHFDEDRQNNANRNLVICQDRAYNKLLHVRASVVRRGGDPDAVRWCGTCQRLLALDLFNRSSRNKATGLQTQCRPCKVGYNAARLSEVL
jgi:hypothetical protein